MVVEFDYYHEACDIACEITWTFTIGTAVSPFRILPIFVWKKPNSSLIIFYISQKIQEIWIEDNLFLEF